MISTDHASSDVTAQCCHAPNTRTHAAPHCPHKQWCLKEDI